MITPTLEPERASPAPQIKREFARGAAIEPNSNNSGDAPNGELAAVGYNLSEGCLDVQAIF